MDHYSEIICLIQQQTEFIIKRYFWIFNLWYFFWISYHFHHHVFRNIRREKKSITRILFFLKSETVELDKIPSEYFHQNRYIASLGCHSDGDMLKVSAPERLIEYGKKTEIIFGCYNLIIHSQNKKFLESSLFFCSIFHACIG